MLPEDTIPAIRQITTTSRDVFAISLEGAVEAADIENFYGLLNSFASNRKNFNVIIIVENYQTIEWSAFFSKDLKKIRRDLAKKIQRFAIAGGPDWLGLAVEFFETVWSAEVRWFNEEQLSDAWDFVGAEPLD